MGKSTHETLLSSGSMAPAHSDHEMIPGSGEVGPSLVKSPGRLVSITAPDQQDIRLENAVAPLKVIHLRGCCAFKALRAAAIGDHCSLAEIALAVSRGSLGNSDNRCCFFHGNAFRYRVGMCRANRGK